MNTVLKCNNVCKNISKNMILNNITFNINRGDIFGFIGPNGAGKTTLIKLILSLQSISSGNISINGYDIKTNYKDAIKGVGAIVENPDFYMYMSGRSNLILKARLYDISKERVSEVIKLVGLESRIDDKVSKYSLGMKQRLGIALSLLNNPSLLILDEPTNGLDPEGIIELRTIIKKLSKEGISILISSHILRELDNLCNRVGIIKNGRMNVIDIDKLNTNGNNSYIFEVDNTDNINLLFEHEILDKNRFKVTCNREFIPLIIESLIKVNIKIYSLKEDILSLEDIFLGGNYV